MQTRSNAPRYSRKAPANVVPFPLTPLPTHRPLLQRVRHTLWLAAQRERTDNMGRIGVALGFLAAVAVVALLASI